MGQLTVTGNAAGHHIKVWYHGSVNGNGAAGHHIKVFYHGSVNGNGECCGSSDKVVFIMGQLMVTGNAAGHHIKVFYHGSVNGNWVCCWSSHKGVVSWVS